MGLTSSLPPGLGFVESSVLGPGPPSLRQWVRRVRPQRILGSLSPPSIITIAFASSFLTIIIFITIIIVVVIVIIVVIVAIAVINIVVVVAITIIISRVLLKRLRGFLFSQIVAAMYTEDDNTMESGYATTTPAVSTAAVAGPAALPNDTPLPPAATASVAAPLAESPTAGVTGHRNSCNTDGRRHQLFAIVALGAGQSEAFAQYRRVLPHLLEIGLGNPMHCLQFPPS